MKKSIIFGLTILLFGSSFAWSDDVTSMEAASNLGNILASEKICGFTFDEDAIRAWIDENTEAADMNFAGMLNLMTSGSEAEIEAQGESQRIAHCHAVERTAKHYGFIK